MIAGVAAGLLLSASVGSETESLPTELHWVGGTGQDIFVEANWDLTNTSVAVVDPNVSIDDDIVVDGAAPTAVIPQLAGQVRLQLAPGRRLTIDGGHVLALGDDGVGGPGGVGSGPEVQVQNGGHLEVAFVVNGTLVALGATGRATLTGTNNPINNSTIDLTLGALLALPGETPAAFANEHLAKVSVGGAPAVVGGNLSVVSDGGSGCLVTVLPLSAQDSDDDLLSDDEEIQLYGTDPLDSDSDDDGTPDGLEVARALNPNDPVQRLQRPNIVFILTDDLGYGDLGVLFQNSITNGKRHFTPGLDQMAAEGAILEQHYCPAPVCAPSRASLLTGVHQGHATVRNNQFDKALETHHNLPLNLRRAGYATALIGKWGLQGSGSGPTSWATYPTRVGFDYFLGYVRHGDGHTHYPAHQTAARPAKDLYENDVEISAQLDKCYTADLFTARAKSYLQERVQANPLQPFFLFLSYDTPHAALHRPTQAYPPGRGLGGGLQWNGVPGNMINTASGTIDSYVHPDYAGNGWTDGEERFATSVRRLDDGVNDLLRTLEDLQIADNTLVIVSSDNGPHAEAYTPGVSYNAAAFDSFGPFDGIKRDVWEGGIRVPTLAWWPGTIPAGRVDPEPSQFHDWMATFGELAGWTTPARSDGVSLLPGLTGAGPREPSTVYVEYFSGSNTPNYVEFDPSHRGRPRRQEQAVILDGFKGVRVDVQGHADPFEIYNLDVDPQETLDLTGTSPFFEDLQQRMRDRVLQLRRPEPSAQRPYDDEPVPAVALPVLSGTEFRSYVGFWPWLPQLESLTPAAAGVVDHPDPARLPADERAGVLFSGLLEIPTTGDWTFRVTGDDGALLRLHDARVLETGPQPRVSTRRGDDPARGGVASLSSVRARRPRPNADARLDLVGSRRNGVAGPRQPLVPRGSHRRQRVLRGLAE